MQVNFIWMQILDPNALALVWNLALDIDTPAVGQFELKTGSQTGRLMEAGWESRGIGRTGRKITRHIPRGVIVSTKAATIGTPADYAKIPSTVRALKDWNATDKTQDIAFLSIDKTTEN